MTAADFDGDGDSDLVVVGAGLALRYYENIGTALLPDFVERVNPVYGTPVNGLFANEFGRLAAVDLDANGKLEIVAGAYFLNPVQLFENEFGPTDPSYVTVIGPHSLSSINTVSAPAFADRDGDFDVVVGGADGTFRYPENLGTAQTASFVLKTGVENPFDGADVGTGSAPALVDSDGDGDLDLITAAADGTLRFARVPEPGISALLAAGGAMLGWITRRRLAPAA